MACTNFKKALFENKQAAKITVVTALATSILSNAQALIDENDNTPKSRKP